MKGKRLFTVLMSVVMCGGVFTGVFAGCNKGKDDPDKDGKDDGGSKVSAPLPAGKKIFLVGDSTVCEFEDKYYLPRYGYGTQIAEYFNVQSGQVENLALSGRSSWSYTYNLAQDKNNKYDDSSSYYEHLTASIKEGDYLLIGFGHNDEKFEIARYTDPTLPSDSTSTMIGTHDAERTTSFKAVLKKYYIDMAVAKKATPVLCTPIVRLQTDANKAKYDSDHVTVTQTVKDSTANVTTEFTGGDYAKAIRELGAETGTVVVDLTAVTREEYKTLGYDEAVKYHAATGAKWADAGKTQKTPVGYDSTHTNKFGAKNNAYNIAKAIAATKSPLAAHVKDGIKKPVYADNASEIVNPDYKISEAEPFKPENASSVWTGITGASKDSATDTEYKWYGTSFGQYGATSNFSITQGSDAGGVTFTVSETTGKSKIESGGDSIGAVFIQIPFAAAFEAEVKATVVNYSGNQAGFGLMLRDDIYIDNAPNPVGSNYVNAGVRGTKLYNTWCYCRNGGALKDSSNRGEVPAGDYTLKISRTSQSVTAFMNDKQYSAVSDFDLAASDPGYVYLCLWVARNTTVTFSGFKFTSGTWQQA